MTAKQGPPDLIVLLNCYLTHLKSLPPIYGGVEITPWPSQPLAIQAASAQDYKRGQDARRGRVAM